MKASRSVVYQSLLLSVLLLLLLLLLLIIIIIIVVVVVVFLKCPTVYFIGYHKRAALMVRAL